MSHRLFFTAIIFPIIQTIIFCSGVGVNIKGLQIAVKSDEINISDCNHSEVSGCILNEKANQTMSCAVTNYLASHDYELVCTKYERVLLKGAKIENIFMGLIKAYTSCKV